MNDTGSINYDYAPDRYANSAATIAALTTRAAEVWDEVTHRTLTSHVVYDDDRIHTVAPRMQYLIEQADIAERSLYDHVQAWKMRGELYHQFVVKHPHPTQDELQDELFQIETYIAYQQGYEPPEEKADLVADPIANIEEMAHYFE